MVGKFFLLLLTIFSGWWIYQTLNSSYSISINLQANPKTILTWLTEEEKLLKWNEGLIQSKIIGDKEINIGFRMRRIYKFNKKELTMFFKLIKFEQNKFVQFFVTCEAFTQTIDIKFKPENESTNLQYNVNIEWNNSVSKFFSPLYIIATKLKLKIIWNN